MTIEKILPYKKFENNTDWKNDSTYDEMKIVNLVGFSFYVGEIRLLNSASGFHSVIGVSTMQDYEEYDIQPLRSILHDYVMNIFSPYTWESLDELTKTFKTMLQYFDIPTDKESYKEERCSITGLTHYIHIESGIQL